MSETARTRRETFEVGGKPKIDLKSLPSGRVSFLPGEDGKVEVLIGGDRADEFIVEHFGSRVKLRAPDGPSHRWGSFEVTVKIPEGATLGANVTSADVETEVDLKTLGFNSASGSLAAHNVTGNAGVNTTSGDVELGSIGGDLGVNTASGDVKVQRAEGDAGINTTSGDLQVGSARSDLEFKSASGDLKVESFSGDTLECATQSGDVKISLPPGRVLEVDLNSVSGDIESELDSEEGSEDAGGAAHLRVKTVSGDITLARALPESR